MKRYSTIHPLYMSFYSKPLYRDVAMNWKKVSFLYLFLLLAICEIPLMFRLHDEVTEYIFQQAPDIVKQVPDISISKGIVSAEVQMPYIIMEPKKNSPLMIIDTTGKTVSLEGSDAFALLTKSELIVRRTRTSTWKFSTSEVDGLIIDKKMVYDLIEAFAGLIPVVMYPLGLLVSFVFRVTQALIFALAGIFLARNMNITLSYSQLVSLSIIAMTPSVMLGTIHDYSGVVVNSWWVISLMIAFGYLWFGVRSASEQPDDEHQPR